MIGPPVDRNPDFHRRNGQTDGATECGRFEGIVDNRIVANYFYANSIVGEGP